MLLLEIEGQAPPGVPPSLPITGERFSIGRETGCGLVLPDTSREISRQHCLLERRQGVWYVTDTSKNGLFVDDGVEPLGRDQRAELRDGMRLRLGEYRIRVRLQPGGPAAGASAAAAGRSEEEAPFSVLDPKVVRRVRPPYHPDGADRVAVGPRPEHAGPGELPLDPAAPRRPDPWRPRTTSEPEPRPGPDRAPRRATFFTSSPGSALGNEAEGAAGVVRHRPSIIGGKVAPPAAEPAPAGEEGPENQAARTGAGPFFKPRPTMGPPASNPAPGPAVPAPAAATGNDETLLSAFLQGAGIAPEFLPPAVIADPAGLMRALGQRYRTMAAALALLLRIRAKIKRETMMDLTAYGGLATNPLKFATDEEAVRSTIAPRGPGYLDPDAAIEQAVADLGSFPAELLGGMRGALRRLLARFAPGNLEGQLEDASLLDRLLPGQRKARYWEEFHRRYAEFAGDAERNFLREVGADDRGEADR